MSSGFVVVDIETICDAPTVDDVKDFPAPPHHEIVCVGWMTIGANHIAESCGIVPGAPLEHDIVRNIASALERNRRTVVTWNGRHFDLPVILARAVRHGVRMPWLSSQGYRYKIEGAFDLCDWLAGYGAARFAKLDAFAKLVGFPGKLGTHLATDTELERYCLCDVANTAAIFLRTQFMRGCLVDFEPAARALLELIDKTPHLTELAPLIDRPSFAMDPSWGNAPG